MFKVVYGIFNCQCQRYLPPSVCVCVGLNFINNLGSPKISLKKNCRVVLLSLTFELLM